MNVRMTLVLLAISVCIISCSRKTQAYRTQNEFQSPDGIPHYDQLEYWAAHPWKWDPSDSVPAPLQTGFKTDSVADVFFLYPTSFTQVTDSRWNASIDDNAINSKTDLTSILYQASAFQDGNRVFAPRYRQANLKAYYTRDTVHALNAFDLAYNDIRTAFLYYLAHYNNGRPVIIASHSQGTTHATRLVKEFFDNQPLQKKLVCAYLLGMAVPEHTFTTVQPCRDSSDLGCFVSWRTYEKGYIEPNFIAKEKFTSVVTNPLLWNTSTDYAPASLNKGGILRDFTTIKEGLVDAQVHGNILWTSKPRFFGNILLTMKNYHIADINFFYVNIRENVTTRVRQYQHKNSISN